MTDENAERRRRRALGNALDELEDLLEPSADEAGPDSTLPILTDIVSVPERDHARAHRPQRSEALSSATAAQQTLRDRLDSTIELVKQEVLKELRADLSQADADNYPGNPVQSNKNITSNDAIRLMEKVYNPHEIEQTRYQQWEENGYFKADLSAARTNGAYCIMLPPPNVTGSLHMGHAFQDTLMDALIRYHRMRGDATLWQCGTDHAGIATQMVVERQLEIKGKSRHELGRDAFVDAVWDWKHESGGTITRQLRRMGTSMDWERERFTLDEGLSAAVAKVFCELYEEGLIYRGKRLVNWDPTLRTAISDLEVVNEEESGSLWHIRYPLVNASPDDPEIIVATTRPETLLGDVAVAVHPDDDRFNRLIGREVELPLTGRTIRIIVDDYVDPEFGSGCLKITPAHDFNDYLVGQRHSLPLINIFDDTAHINDNGPPAYRGLDRYVARKQIVMDLEREGLLIKTEDHRLMVPRGDRSQAVVEPYLTDQWFVKIKPLAEPAIKAVEDGQIRFVPEHRAKTYFDWMYNIEDWCISRQLWWGHQIPAWYGPDNQVYVGESEAQIRQRYSLPEDVPLSRDEDVLDTWFSSALWPFSTLGWPEKTDELNTFYPTSVLVTGHDIIFFWVARMIMMGLKFMGDVPFREVYVHGLVRDADGNKMSKSKGNVLDPIDLIDGVDLDTLIAKRTKGLMRPQDAARIEKATRRQFADGIPSYGTDALRFTFAALATQGLDVKFDLGRIEGYRNFCNKIWNAARFTLMMCDGKPIATELPTTDGLSVADQWILARLDRLIDEVDANFAEYRFDLASQAMHRFVWDDYCDWYVEVAKIELNDDRISDQRKANLRRVLVEVLEQWLRVLHPIIPFITEEIWQRVAPLLGQPAATIMREAYPRARFDGRLADAETEFTFIQEIISGVRRIRAERDIDPRKPLPVIMTYGDERERSWLAQHHNIVLSMARISDLREAGNTPVPDGATALAGESSLLVPLADMIDPAAELARLDKEIEDLEKQMKVAHGKLKNEAFVAKAPEPVVKKERDKLTEATTKREKLLAQRQKIEALL